MWLLLALALAGPTPGAPPPPVVRVEARTQPWHPALEGFLRRHGAPLPVRRDAPERPSSGTAFATADGTLTAWHGVRGAHRIELVDASGARTRVGVARARPDLDVAWLTAALAPWPVADAAPGDAVTLIGFPTGASARAEVAGRITGTRTAPVGPADGPHLVTDAVVRPGMSGGPAVAGEAVVGMIVAGLGDGDQGPGIVLPASRWQKAAPEVGDPRRCPSPKPCLMRTGHGWVALAGEP